MPKKNSLIWSIKDPNNKAMPTSYLLATMHVKDARAFVRMEDMQTCINQCDFFATEFNLEEAEALVVAETMSLPEDVTLESLLGEKKYNKMNGIFQKAFQLDMDFFNNNLPIMLSNIITEKILSDDMQHSLDATLSNYAREQGKTCIGIETFQEQMDILEQIPMEYQLKALKKIAKNVGTFREKVLALTGWYVEEDISQLYQSARKSAGEIRHLMLTDRNIKMAERLAKMIPEQSIAFALGAAHLAGKHGLLSLLKKEGFKVKAVREMT